MDEKKKFCTNCGKEIDKDSLFCKECGKGKSEDKSTNLDNNPQTKKCKKCKEDIDKKSKKCPKCGARQGMPVWLIVIIVIFGFFVLISLFDDDTSNNNQKQEGNYNQNNITTEDSTKNNNEQQNSTESTIENAKPNESTETKQQYKDKCKKIKYKNLARNPQKYEGQFVKFKGEVIQVSEGWLNNVTLRVNVTKGEYDIWEDTILVNYEYANEKESKILEDDIIKIYGQFKGTTSYESILGQTITIPEVDAKYITIKK